MSSIGNTASGSASPTQDLVASILADINTLPKSPYKAPQKTASQVAGPALDNAKGGAVAAVVPVTGFLLKDVFTPSRPGGYLGKSFGDAIKMCEVVMLPGAVIVDAVKLPVAGLFAVEEGLRGGILSLGTKLFGKIDTETTESQIFASFLGRMVQAIEILKVLGLNDGNADSILGLSLLTTAYASRDLGKQEIALNDGFTMRRKQCPRRDLPLFDAVRKLATALHKAELPADNDKASAVLRTWVPRLKASLENGAALTSAPGDGPVPAIATEILILLRDVEKKAKESPVRQDKSWELREAIRSPAKYGVRLHNPR